MSHAARRATFTISLGLAVLASAVAAQGPGWYTQGDFKPAVRLVFELVNDLDIPRVNTPVIIRRDQMPIRDLHELEVTVVDPALPPAPAPTPERLKLAGGHEIREESNGHALFQQMDDLDKDGVWDELFFVTTLAPKEKRRLELYLGMNQRGWNPHETHAGLGSYVRHLMPFWESKHIGWKLWFPTSVDVYGKRTPMLMANRLYMENLDGYAVGLIDKAMGSDIQSVDNSFGGGGIGLFESPEAPAKVSVPRFTPARDAAGVKINFNAGPIGDTRYVFDVVANGPMRSMVRVRTLNWNTGKGNYEVEQLYTAYAYQSYSTCRVTFTKFLPKGDAVRLAAGIRKKPREDRIYQKGGVVITAGPEAVADPDEGTITHDVAMIASALVVKDDYAPEYQFVPDLQGNHTFRFAPRADGVYEYLIAGAWSEGAVLNTYEQFEQYVLTTAREYGSPVGVRFVAREAGHRSFAATPQPSACGLRPPGTSFTPRRQPAARGIARSGIDVARAVEVPVGCRP